MLPFITFNNDTGVHNTDHRNTLYEFGLDLVVGGAIEATLKYKNNGDKFPPLESIKFEIIDESKIAYLNHNLNELEAVWRAHSNEVLKEDEKVVGVVFRGETAATLAPFVMATLYASKPSISMTVLKDYFPPAVTNRFRNPFTNSFVDAAEKLNWIDRDIAIRDKTNNLDFRIVSQNVQMLSNMYENRRKMQPIFDRGSRYTNNLNYLSGPVISVEDALMKLYVYKVHIDAWPLRGEKDKIGKIVANIRDQLVYALR